MPDVMRLMYQIEGDRVYGYNILGIIVAFLPLGVVLLANANMSRMSRVSANFFYWAIVAAVGVSTAVLLYIYTGPSLAVALLVSGLSFAGLSLIGYITKMNLGPLGNFMGAALWGLVISSAILFFVPLNLSPLMFMAMSGIGVVVSAGLIASITQNMKYTYYATLGDEQEQRIAQTLAAMALFIQLSNLFRFLLAFVGVRR